MKVGKGRGVPPYGSSKPWPGRCVRSRWKLNRSREILQPRNYFLHIQTNDVDNIHIPTSVTSALAFGTCFGQWSVSIYDICHFCVKRKLCYNPFCWQRDKDASENWSFFLMLLPHEGLLALTKIHIHPEVPSSKMEDAKEKDAVNAKMKLCHRITVWPWGSHFPSGISFLICKVKRLNKNRSLSFWLWHSMIWLPLTH